MDYVELVLLEELSQFFPKFYSYLHLNTRSATNKQCYVSFDIIMFPETWYKQDADMLVLPDYTNFFLNRNHKRGGGVSIPVKIFN